MKILAFLVLSLCFSNSLNAQNPILENEGFTKLGDVSPSIKMKKIKGKMPNAVESITIPHGVGCAAAILGVNVAVRDVSSSYVLPGLVTTGGRQYDVKYGNASVIVQPVNGNSAQILGDSIFILVIYDDTLCI